MVRIPEPSPPTPACRDAFDLPLLHLAIARSACALVAGDRDLLAPDGAPGVMSIGGFCRQFLGGRWVQPPPAPQVCSRPPGRALRSLLRLLIQPKNACIARLNTAGSATATNKMPATAPEKCASWLTRPRAWRDAYQV